MSKFNSFTLIKRTFSSWVIFNLCFLSVHVSMHFVAYKISMLCFKKMLGYIMIKKFLLNIFFKSCILVRCCSHYYGENERSCIVHRCQVKNRNRFICDPDKIRQLHTLRNALHYLVIASLKNIGEHTALWPNSHQAGIW